MKRQWTNEELQEHWMLSPKELDLIGDSKTDHNLLGFAVLLKYFQYEGRFPSQKQDIPAALTLHLAQQADFSSQFSSEKMIESRKEKSQEKEVTTQVSYRLAKG